MARPLTLSTPVLALVFGVPFGIAMGIYDGARSGHSRSLTAHLVVGVVCGVLFGVIMTIAMRRQLTHTRGLVGSASGREVRKARRAVVRGPVPTDPETRALALRLGGQTVDQLQDRKTLPLFTGLTVLSVLLGVTQSAWWFLGTAEFALILLLYLTYYRPERLQRRLARIRQHGA